MLSYVGLKVLGAPAKKPQTPPPRVDISKLNFAELPSPRAAILLATYDFINANKLFSHNFVNYQETDPTSMLDLAREEGIAWTDEKIVEPPICAYFSLTSYLLHHAHRSARSALYARLNLLVLRIMLEDLSLCKRLISDETKGIVRLCRQKPPHLPIFRGKRVLLTAVIDMVADGINHNLRKRLDVELYISLMGILMRTISFLIRTRTRLGGFLVFLETGEQLLT